MSRRFALGLLVGLCLWRSPLYAAAEEDRLSDAKGLENFVDEFFESHMNRLHIPGLVLTVVKDGKPILTKGFGWADMESGKRVVAEKTVFRVGSVSKLFTAAALLQLVERGSIDLNADVSMYLNPVDIDDNFREPVTADHLLTHTAGFDDRYIGIATRHQADRSPLPEYISARLPPRIRPPGELIAYSNHGYALAGLLVEEISGVPFETYVDEHLFRPLRMTRTSFELPARLEVDLAVGYRYLEDEFLPASYDYFNVAPASSLSSTAPDMARFMIAQLQDGSFQGSRILLPDTKDEMQRRHFAHHPRLPSRTYGFHERFENGERIIAHAGGLRGYSSYFLLLPQRNVGFFLASNRFEEELHEEFRGRFLDRYFPASSAAVTRVPSSRQPIERFKGSYRSLRYFASRSFEKLMTLASEYRVTAEDDTLTVRYPDDFHQPSQWESVEPLLFRRLDHDGYLAFREDESGEVTHMFIGTEAYEKLVWYETPTFQKKLFAFFPLAFLVAALTGGLLYGAGQLRSSRSLRSQHSLVNRPHRLAYYMAISVSVLNFSFLVGLSYFGRGVDSYSYLYGMPAVMIGVLLIPLLTAGLSLALAAVTSLGWNREVGSLSARLYFSLTTILALIFIPFLHYWNLLGFRY